ncbi:MAG: hypothetical protein PCFJNLEI_00973 [Verrucomicrobiae bacterium]|nr:hypothetical protein [Verrucomicrobiae bacterium]
MQVPHRWILAFVAGAILTVVQPVLAVNYTWTNTVSDASGYWTNGILWGQTVGTYPGSAGSDAAYLTNQFSGSATTILDAPLSATISTLAISNALGEAWVRVQNTTLTNSTFVLGSGGRLAVASGGVVTGISTVTWLGTNGAIYLNDGGKLFTSSTAKSIGTGGSVTGLVTSAGGGGAWYFNGAALTMGGVGGNDNLLRVSQGAVLTNLGALTLASDRNRLIATEGSKIFGTGNIIFSATANRSGNTINLGDGLWNLNSGSLVVGGAANSSNNTFIGGTVINARGLIVGNAALVSGNLGWGANGNTVIFTNAGSGFSMNAAGPILVGANSNQQGQGVDNTVILSNSFLWSNNHANIGSQGSTNNTLTLLAGTVFNGGSISLNVGGWGLNELPYGGSSNTLNLIGALATNFNLVRIGYTTKSAGNQLLISDGGVLSNFNSLTVGYFAGADGNRVIVTNNGRLFMTSGSLSVGGAGGSANTVILSNSVLTSTTVPSFGNNGTNNALTLLAGTVWNNGNHTLTLGSGVGAGNVLTIDGALVTGVGSLTIGNSTGSISNQLIIRNGGVLTNTATTLAGALQVGYAKGADYNSLIASNGSLIMTTYGRIQVGAAGGGLTGGSYNTVVLSNSLLLADWATHIGSGSTNNTVTVLGNTVWDNRNVFLYIGAYSSAAGAGVGNIVTVNNSIITNINGVVLGNGAGAINFGNALIITNGGRVEIRASGLVMGSGGSSSNTVLLTDRSVLEANLLTIGAATTGNTISNRNATYQFTAAPTVTSQTPGDIAITDGTISFRATSAANVTNTVANQISKIQFAGANTFQLNNASNTAAAVSQTYTFDTVAGNPSNYVRLVMVNGPTAYGNANGANVTIGAGGSFLASNTLATMTGVFTNNGLAEIVDATVNFQSALAVAGTMRLNNGYVTGAGAKTIAGTLAGHGSVVGDASASGTISPGFSLGTLVFSNDFTLTGTYAAEFGDAGNDQLVVVGDLTLSGATLDLTAVGGVTGEAYVIASYGDLFGTFSVTNGMPVGYMVDYNYNGASQIAVVLIPEPSSIVLAAAGLVLLMVLRRQHSRKRS